LFCLRITWTPDTSKLVVTDASANAIESSISASPL
jgi:hypothetical protein